MKEKMKLTKSKQFLADAIRASGKGWHDGADFAVQDKDMWICLYEGKPTRHGDAWKDDGDCLYKLGFAHNKLAPNWPQCVLSREEYFSAYPEEPVADADGWIEWKGGACPVDSGVCVEVKRERGVEVELRPEVVNLVHYGTIGDIIAYRLHKPEFKPDFCESVTRSIPEPEDKPTIEQLAADYRNAKDYAERKQQEADAAKADAEAKLALLVETGKAHGLVVSPINEKQEPEMVITDWRDLQVGDEVQILSSMSGARIGEVGVVSRFDGGDCGREVRVHFNGNEGDFEWLTGWKFIRRP